MTRDKFMKIYREYEGVDRLDFSGGIYTLELKENYWSTTCGVLRNWSRARRMSAIKDFAEGIVFIKKGKLKGYEKLEKEKYEESVKLDSIEYNIKQLKKQLKELEKQLKELEKRKEETLCVMETLSETLKEMI
ncbi:MAG: hypothetical protein ACRC6E_13930 [Fusobacteriaceae bacterium]